MKFAFFLILLFSALNLTAQSLEEIDSKIKIAVADKDYSNAIKELQNFARADNKLFALNNYDYLLARIAEKSGDSATAMVNYQAVSDRNSILSEYALKHLAQIARVSGNLLLERIYLQKLLTVAPDSLLNDAANARMARSYFESNDFATVIRLLNQPKINSSIQENLKSTVQNPTIETTKPKIDNRNPKIRENLALTGQSYLQSGKSNEAREVFSILTNELPNAAQPDDFALIGARGLDEVEVGKENFGKSVGKLTDIEHFRRATIYQFNRDFAAARMHFQMLVKNFPQSANVADALYQIGRGFAQEGNYNEAINWFERVQVEFPDSDQARDALSQTASAYSRVNKPKEAIVRYQKFIEKYPDADNLERAYLNIVDVLRDKGEEIEALKWTAKTQAAFRGKLPEALALFAQARIHITQNDWQNALNDLNNLQNFPDLGGTRVPGGTNKAEVTFLKGLVLENLNRYAEAIDVYLSIPDGRSEYYGWRATERLRALAKDEKTISFTTAIFANLMHELANEDAKTQKESVQSVLRFTENTDVRRRLLEVLQKAYANLSGYQKIPQGKLLVFGRRNILKEKSEKPVENRHQAIADELLFLELYDEATPELEVSQQNTNPKSGDFAYTLAVFYKRGEMANRAVAYAEPLWRNVPADYQIELMPSNQIELLYPTPYTDSLLQFAPAKNVDPRFILAIMRQESRFRADVKSNAAARGLLQFISTTADRLAIELKRDNFKQDELYNPPTAISFGAQYLSNLFRQFPNQPAAVAASYNGGEDNVARWIKRAKTEDADRYVPEIAFTQSKDYVYKVMAGYRVYQMFYNEQLRGK